MYDFIIIKCNNKLSRLEILFVDQNGTIFFLFIAVALRVSMFWLEAVKHNEAKRMTIIQYMFEIQRKKIFAEFLCLSTEMTS